MATEKLKFKIELGSEMWDKPPIAEVLVNDIDIGALIFEGIYRPEYPEPWASQQTQQGIKLPDTIKNSPSMGHNGTWTFSFTSPFYMWLLENLY